MVIGNSLQIRQNSSDSEWFEGNQSKGLAQRDRIELAAGILPVFYPKGGVFFLEGQSATGVFLLCSGRAKESMISSKGKTAIVRVVGPGAILGLSAVLTSSPHESTIETLEPTHADFMRKSIFLRFLQTSPKVGQMVVNQLSRNCIEAYASIRCLGVSESVAERLARLLFHWAENPLSNRDQGTVGVRIRVTHTHEEIGEFIGSSRETMSRTLGEFRKRKWVTVNGSVWTLANEFAIRHLAGI